MKHIARASCGGTGAVEGLTHLLLHQYKLSVRHEALGAKAWQQASRDPMHDCEAVMCIALRQYNGQRLRNDLSKTSRGSTCCWGMHERQAAPSR